MSVGIRYVGFVGEDGGSVFGPNGFVALVGGVNLVYLGCWAGFSQIYEGTTRWGLKTSSGERMCWDCGCMVVDDLSLKQYNICVDTRCSSKVTTVTCERRTKSAGYGGHFDLGVVGVLRTVRVEISWLTGSPLGLNPSRRMLHVVIEMAGVNWDMQGVTTALIEPGIPFLTVLVT